MPDPQPIGPIAPFFIVKDLARAVDHYTTRLGFELRLALPDEDPFFAIVGRDEVQLLLKAVADDVGGLANVERHPWALWDAFVHADDPDALAKELAARGATFHCELTNREDGLRGFEVRDPEGYVLFFGRPSRGDAGADS